MFAMVFRTNSAFLLVVFEDGTNFHRPVYLEGRKLKKLKKKNFDLTIDWAQRRPGDRVDEIFIHVLVLKYKPAEVQIARSWGD